jgi:hypothetical protein
MEPLNKKEINTSFIQFIVMFLLTVLFAIICVFFDIKFFNKDYSVLKNKLKEKESEISYLHSVENKIDSVKKVVSELKEQDPKEFDIMKEYLFNNLLVIDLRDTTLTTKIDNSIHDMGRQWLNDKQRLLKNADLEMGLQRKNKLIQTYANRLMNECGLSKDQINLLNNTIGD